MTGEYKVEVSRRLKDEFDNGKEYYALRGKRILVPDSAPLRPSPQLLEWHNENVYRRRRDSEPMAKPQHSLESRSSSARISLWHSSTPFVISRCAAPVTRLEHHLVDHPCRLFGAV